MARTRAPGWEQVEYSVKCSVEVALLLVALGQLEQQLGPARLQPAVVFDGLRQLGQHIFRRLVTMETIATAEDRVEVVDVLPALEGPRLPRDGDFLVLEDAEVGEHELRPELVEVAEEHEPEAFAQGRMRTR